MDDKIEVRTKVTYQYIPSSGEYHFVMSVSIPADDRGYLPEVLRNERIQFFEQPLTKMWGELKDGVLHAQRTMKFYEIEHGEKGANFYITTQIRELEQVARVNRIKAQLSKYKRKEDIDFHI